MVQNKGHTAPKTGEMTVSPSPASPASLSSLRFASLRFSGEESTGRGPAPRRPLPHSAVEEALGSAEVGAFPPTLGLAGGVRLVRTQPSLYFSPHPSPRSLKHNP